VRKVLIAAGVAIGVAMVAVSGVVVWSVVTSSSPSTRQGPPGWLGTSASTVLFLQWTQGSGGALNGSVELVAVQDPTSDPYTVTPASYSVSGVRAGSTVSFTVHGGLGFTQTWDGQFRGSKELDLNVPQRTGALQTYVLSPATTDGYNNAAGLLQEQVAAQKAAADRAAADARAQQQQAAALAQQQQQQAAALAQQQREQAAAQAAAATLAAFRSTCSKRGGSLSQTDGDERGYDAPPGDSAGEYCVVSYTGEGSFQVPVGSDGIFFQTAADENRDQCSTDTSDAQINALDGHPWAKLPDYHATTGVCFRGTR
jgi:hypothetical protein